MQPTGRQQHLAAGQYFNRSGGAHAHDAIFHAHSMNFGLSRRRGAYGQQCVILRSLVANCHVGGGRAVCPNRGSRPRLFDHQITESRRFLGETRPDNGDERYRKGDNGKFFHDRFILVIFPEGRLKFLRSLRCMNRASRSGLSDQ